jgi:hypothetical protein
MTQRQKAHRTHTIGVSNFEAMVHDRIIREQRLAEDPVMIFLDDEWDDVYEDVLREARDDE